jgi:hypothetical protein
MADPPAIARRRSLPDSAQDCVASCVGEKLSSEMRARGQKNNWIIPKGREMCQMSMFGHAGWSRPALRPFVFGFFLDLTA